MKKEIFDFLSKEFMYIGALFLLALAIFKVVFFKEGLVFIFRIVLSIFWIFVLPGYFIISYWRGKLDFMERFLIGTGVAAGINGVASYYLGLFGLNIKYHIIILPLAMILTGFILLTRNK